MGNTINAFQEGLAAGRRTPAGMLAWLGSLDARIGAEARRKGGWTVFGYEFVWFGIKQAYACLFGGLMLALLIATHQFYPRDATLARYDFLVVAAVSIQVLMLLFKLETTDEAKVILLFHLVGTVMEIFKTAVGSWVYPEASLLRIGGVPLFTGFMYGAIGSYIARCWRLFDFRFSGHPPLWTLGVLSGAIYVNFFAHHFVADVRVVLFAVAAALIGPATIHFRIDDVHRKMPLLLGLVLVALFIWIAENIGTFTAAWVYPHQRVVWHAVGIGKMGAWFLLMLISYTMVAAVSGIVPMKDVGARECRAACAFAATSASSDALCNRR